jgi:hypothetical protein
MGKTYTQGEVLTALDLNASLAEAVNTCGYFVFTGQPGDLYLTGEHIHNARLTANAIFEVNTSPSYFYTQLNVSGADIRITRGGGISVIGTGTVSVASDITSTGGIVSDKLGNLRSVPPSSPATGYTLKADDAGKFIYRAGGTLTIPNSIFSPGDTVTIHNSSTSAAMTITQGTGLTMYWAGQSTATSGNRTLGLTGLCTIAFITASSAVIAGNGLS